MHENATSLAVGLRQLWRNPLFQGGLAIRLALLVFAAPWIWTSWFVPFVQAFLADPSLDPWTPFVAAGGDALSYPYGPVMLALNAATVAVGNGLALATGWAHGAAFGFGLSLLVADLAVLVVLCRLCDDWSWRLPLVYWLSPLAIYISFFHGQVDIIPLSLLMLGLLALKQRNAALSGVLIGFSVAAKLTFVIACPLPLIFLWRSKRRRPMLLPFMAALAVTVLLLQAPWLLSPGVHEMTLRNPNANSLYRFAIEIAPAYRIYIAPLVYALFLYSLWRLERLSFDLLLAGTGLAFLIVVILTPATLGWYLWIVPFLALHQRNAGANAIAVVGAFTAAIMAFHLVASTGAAVPVLGLTGEAPGLAALGVGGRYLPLLATGIMAVGIVLGLQIYRRGIRNNDFFRLSRQPVTVGVAGDSGSGKDTLSTALGGLFGSHSVVAVSGDDYHKWDRHAPMWNSYTHLNPHANDLAALARDVSQLRRGEAVFCRRYDHATGRFAPAELLRANDCIIVSGLHALYFTGLVGQLDTRIFLDMDEDLRRHLKIERDVGERGHSRDVVMDALSSRSGDSEKYVRPQMSRADIVFSLRAENPELLDECQSLSELKFALGVTLRYGILYQEIARVLIGVCGLRLDTGALGEDGAVEFTVEGEASAGDLQLAARMLLPTIDELLDFEPRWQDGMIGVMQLVSLVQIGETLRTRSELRRAE